jgi:lipopolysaccharide exporter
MSSERLDPAGRQSLERRMAAGAGWMILFKLLERMLGVVSTLVLARLLVPADFGLIAMATAVAAVLEALTWFSFDLALIQNQRADRRHYDTVWTFNVLTGVVGAIVLALLARPVAAFYGEPRVEAVMYISGLSFFIQGLGNVGIVAFQKELMLHKEFNLGISKKLIQIFVTIPAAWYLRDYWALLLGMLASRIAGVLLSYWMQSYRPSFSLSAAAEMLHFSKWLLMNNILIFINNRGLDFVIGRLIGPTSLGLYSVAYEISNLPTTELVYPISRAVYPGYSRLSADKEQLGASIISVIALVVLLVVPIGAGIACLAHPLVVVLLGAKWLDTVPLIQMLAIFGILRVCQANTGSAYLALGIPQYVSYLTALHIAIAMPISILGLNLVGIAGAPWGPIAAAMISLPVNVFVLFRKLDLPIYRLLVQIWRSIFATLLMAAGLVLVQQHLGLANDVISAMEQLVIGLLVGLSIYTATLALLWTLSRATVGAERTIVLRLGEAIRLGLGRLQKAK